MPHATRPGDVLADRYRLVDLLTESGDGRFWRAHDRVLERHVAIHTIRGDDPRAPGLMDAARCSATVLDHRILRVLDADLTDEVCYVVNEWGWGASLDIVAAGTGPLAPRSAAWLVSEVADSIAAAHAVGIVHGRLNPENVLIDRTGGVRIIGLCVDAALHGVTTDDTRHDLTDLAGLLHCALTAGWGGASGSIVKPAPRDHGELLRPRQVRAGVPRPLDSLCAELLQSDTAGRHRELGAFAASARGISDYLADFVGNPTGMAVALLAATPPVLPDEELVVLPQVPEMTPHESARLTTADAPPEPSAGLPTVAVHAPVEGPVEAPAADLPTELPTEAGLPIFGPDGDDVSWLERRTTAPAPPPPFEEPPERPLFAPEPRAGEPVRTPRSVMGPATEARQRDGYWPWDTGTGHGSPSSTRLTAVEDEPVPGRSSFRVAGILLAVLLLAVAIVVAVNLGRGRGVLGAAEQSADPTSGVAGDARTGALAAPLADVSATAFDPLGDGAENDDTAATAVDKDPATAWTTQGYEDQLGSGPRALKSGVGLLLDLGGPHRVRAVDLTMTAAPTTVSVYVTAEPPAGVADLDPTGSTTIRGDAGAPGGVVGTIELAAPVTGRYVVVWLTSLPADGPLFRGRVGEVVVRGE